MSCETLNTPCFIIDREEFESNINGFQTALQNFYRNAIVSYSVKTNSFSGLLEIAKMNNCYAEVVSEDEYYLALKTGYLPEQIVYNGPMKTRETFQQALLGGAYVNIENFREVEWLRDIKDKKNLKLGVRLNINLKQVSPEDVKEEEDFSRFGFSYENGEFQKVLSKIEGMGIRVCGIHVHRTSKTRSLNVYKKIAQYTSDIIEKTGLNVDYVDMGGGFYGNMPGKPTYYDYAKVIYENLRVSKDTTVIVEPGNALIASPVSYMLSVLDTKEIMDKIICITDGSRIDIDPLFHKENYLYDILCEEERESETKMQILTGCTCLEFDKIIELKNSKKLQAGDRVLFFAVGAYTMTLTPNFIRLIPNVYVKSKDVYLCLRDKWTAQEWTQKSRIGVMENE